MIVTMIKHRTDNSGFALLLTLVVVSVVLAIGLTLVDITLKQLTLSGTGRDSEIAFHAAHAGAECAHYTRLNTSVEDLTSGAPDLEQCLDESGVGGDYTRLRPNVHLSQYEIDWVSGGDGRCTQIDLYLFNASRRDVQYNIPQFDADTPEKCEEGSVCTFILSRGYNRACGNIDDPGFVIQREVLLTL